MGACCSEDSRNKGNVEGSFKQNKTNNEPLRDLNFPDYPEISEDKGQGQPIGTEKLHEYLSTRNPPNKTSQEDKPENMQPSNLMNKEGVTAKAAIDLYATVNLEGKQNVMGPYAYVDSSTYTGQFSKGQRSGVGKAVYLDGSVYLGEWKEDQKWGEGIFAFDDGELYKGEFFGDFAHGKGKEAYFIFQELSSSTMDQDMRVCLRGI